MPFIVCLPTFAVIDLFRLVHPAETNRVAVILNLCLAIPPAIGLNVFTFGNLLCMHNTRFRNAKICYIILIVSCIPHLGFVLFRLSRRSTRCCCCQYKNLQRYSER